MGKGKLSLMMAACALALAIAPGAAWAADESASGQYAAGAQGDADVAAQSIAQGIEADAAQESAVLDDANTAETESTSTILSIANDEDENADTDDAVDVISDQQDDSESAEEPANEPAEDSDADDADIAVDDAVEDGLYELVSAVDEDKVLDIAGGSVDNGAAAQIYDENTTMAQRYRFAQDDDGTYTIINVGSGKALDVAGASREAGARVQQYDPNGTAAQKWSLVKEGEYYYVVSQLTSSDGSQLVLDVAGASDANGARVQLYTLNRTKAQLWKLIALKRSIADGYYSIASSIDAGKVLDVAGGDPRGEVNVQIYDANDTMAQTYELAYQEDSGYYRILSARSGKAVDTAADGNAWIYYANGTAAQLWQVNANADGTYSLISARNGKVLDLAGANTANGSNVQTYAANGTAAQRWMLLGKAGMALDEGAFTIAPAESTGYAVDVAGGSTAQYANAQLYAMNGTAAQVFQVIAMGDGTYLLRNSGSGKYLTIVADGAEAGSNVVQERQATDTAFSQAQLWKPELMVNGIVLRSAAGLVLDIEGGVFNNGVNVQGYTANGTAAQRFVFFGLSPVPDMGVTDCCVEAGRSTVYSTLIDGAMYLFLPSVVDAEEAEFGARDQDGDGIIYLSDTVGGTYEAVGSGEEFDFASRGLVDDGGMLTLYVKGSSSGTARKLIVMQSSGIGTVLVDSSDAERKGRAYVDGSADHSTKASGDIYVYNASGKQTNSKSSKLDEIRGRGNSTWVFSDKRPYQVKLDKKQDLVGCGDKAKTWILLANASDATMLHNAVAYNLAYQMGLTGTPQFMFVDFYYDGEYRGTYLLCEKVQINPGRVDINDLEEDIEDACGDLDFDSLPKLQEVNQYGYTYQYVQFPTGLDDEIDELTSEIDGGYLIELDAPYYQDEVCWFQTSAGAFAVKSPEFLTKKTMARLSEQVEEALRSLTSAGVNAETGKSYSEYFDVDTLVKYYLLNDFIKNIDVYASSTFFYLPAINDENGLDHKWYSGPVWDVDTSFGVRSECGSIGYTYAGHPIARFRINSDPMRIAGLQSAAQSYFDSFSQLVNDMVLGDASTPGSIDYYESLISSSQKMNQILWGLTAFNNCLTPFSTYEANVSYMKTWVQNRLDWYTQAIAGWNGTPLESAETKYDGYDYALVFDTLYYSQLYPDTEGSLEHFVKYGMSEGRQASRNFDVWIYRARYADLQAAFGDDLPAYYRHYIDYGFREGRIAV